MALKYTKSFHCKTLLNLPKSDFWFENIPSGNPGRDQSFQARVPILQPTQVDVYVHTFKWGFFIFIFILFLNFDKEFIQFFLSLKEPNLALS
jgi:hypothetical protein